MILEQCKGVHCVDLGESFQTHIYLQNLASIQPRTSPAKFAGDPSADLEPVLADCGPAAHALGLLDLRCVFELPLPALLARGRAALPLRATAIRHVWRMSVYFMLLLK